jgi:hypothetical protein
MGCHCSLHQCFVPGFGNCVTVCCVLHKN